jgi:hypothetical protein
MNLLSCALRMARLCVRETTGTTVQGYRMGAKGDPRLYYFLS